MGDASPQLRASDADREHAAELLRRAAGEGRLTVDELDERLHQALEARTRGELESLLADVVVGPADRLPVGAPSAGGAGVTVRPGPGGSRWLISIMGGATRRGSWRLGERCTAINFWGGCDLDLHGAELAAHDVYLNVFTLMGGGDLRVPDGLNVEVSELAIMGGNDVRLGEACPDPGGPTVHVRLVTIMGGFDIRRGRRRSRRERREERRLEREQRELERRRGALPEPPDPPQPPGLQ